MSIRNTSYDFSGAISALENYFHDSREVLNVDEKLSGYLAKAQEIHKELCSIGKTKLDEINKSPKNTGLIYPGVIESAIPDPSKGRVLRDDLKYPIRALKTFKTLQDIEQDENTLSGLLGK